MTKGLMLFSENMSRKSGVVDISPTILYYEAATRFSGPFGSVTPAETPDSAGESDAS